MFVSLFTADAIWQRPSVAALRGQGEIRTFMEGQPTVRTIRHVNGLCLVTVNDDGTAAAAISQTTVYDTVGPSAIPAPLSGPDMVVEYSDAIVNIDGIWLFARRDTTVVFSART